MLFACKKDKTTGTEGDNGLNYSTKTVVDFNVADNITASGLEVRTDVVKTATSSASWKPSVKATAEFAVPEKDGKLEVSFLIYSLPGYREGNRTWCLYDFEHEEWVEQDEDCFDLDTVLEECGRHWDP
jgi:hypothetical protein